MYIHCIKHLPHTCHVSDGDRRSLHFLHLGVNADLVLAAWSKVIEALSGSTTSQADFLPLTICKYTTKQRKDLVQIKSHKIQTSSNPSKAPVSH